MLNLEQHPYVSCKPMLNLEQHRGDCLRSFIAGNAGCICAATATTVGPPSASLSTARRARGPPTQLNHRIVPRVLKCPPPSTRLCSPFRRCRQGCRVPLALGAPAGLPCPACARGARAAATDLSLVAATQPPPPPPAATAAAACRAIWRASFTMASVSLADALSTLRLSSQSPGAELGHNQTAHASSDHGGSSASLAGMDDVLEALREVGCSSATQPPLGHCSRQRILHSGLLLPL